MCIYIWMNADISVNEIDTWCSISYCKTSVRPHIFEVSWLPRLTGIDYMSCCPATDDGALCRYWRHEELWRSTSVCLWGNASSAEYYDSLRAYGNFKQWPDPLLLLFHMRDRDDSMYDTRTRQYRIPSHSKFVYCFSGNVLSRVKIFSFVSILENESAGRK